MNKIILDTSYLVGLIYERDNYHTISLSIENNLIKKNVLDYYITNHELFLINPANFTEPDSYLKAALMPSQNLQAFS